MKAFRSSGIFSWVQGILFASQLLLLASIMGCVTPRSSSHVTNEADPNAYKYMLISPPIYNGLPGDQYGLAAYATKKFQRAGFQTLGSEEAQRQPFTNVLRGLTFTMQHNHTPDVMGGSYATVAVLISDAFKNTVYQGTGRYQGLSISGDLHGALDQALKGFFEKFTGFDPSKQPMAWEQVKSRIADPDRPVATLKNKEELLNYYERNAINLAGIEGIWTSGDGRYEVGIYAKDHKPGDDYIAVVLKTEDEMWQAGLVKMTLSASANLNAYTVVYYLRDHSKQRITGIVNPTGCLNLDLQDLEGTSFKMMFLKNYPRVKVSASAPEQLGAGVRYTGSGAIVSKTGIVVGNYHVVEDAKLIRVVLPGSEKRFLAQLVIKDEKNDLALLKLQDFSFEKEFTAEIPFKVADSKNVAVGQEVFTVGYPLGLLLGKSPKLSTGVVSSLYGIRDDPTHYQITAPIQPGCSGSPLFNKNGEIIGVIVATLNAKKLLEKADAIPQNVNFAIKSSYLINLISMLPGANDAMPFQHSFEGQDLASKVQTISPYIVSIEVE